MEPCRTLGEPRPAVDSEVAQRFFAEVNRLAKRFMDRSQRDTVGADKAYDSEDFVSTARELNVTVHVQKNEKGRCSRIDRRTTRHAGYPRSLSRRWLVEKTFGWLKGPVRSAK